MTPSSRDLRSGGWFSWGLWDSRLELTFNAVGGTVNFTLRETHLVTGHVKNTKVTYRRLWIASSSTWERPRSIPLTVSFQYIYGFIIFLQGHLGMCTLFTPINQTSRSSPVLAIGFPPFATPPLVSTIFGMALPFPPRQFWRNDQRVTCPCHMQKGYSFCPQFIRIIPTCRTNWPTKHPVTSKSNHKRAAAVTIGLPQCVLAISVNQGHVSVAL